MFCKWSMWVGVVKVANWGYPRHETTLPKKSLATLDGEIVDPEIAVEIEIWDVLKVHGAQT